MPERPTGLGPCDLLTVAEAVRALRIREADARRWIRERGLVRRVEGRDLVVWGEVVRAISGAVEEPPSAAPRPRGRQRFER